MTLCKGKYEPVGPLRGVKDITDHPVRPTKDLWRGHRQLLKLYIERGKGSEGLSDEPGASEKGSLWSWRWIVSISEMLLEHYQDRRKGRKNRRWLVGIRLRSSLKRQANHIHVDTRRTSGESTLAEVRLGRWIKMSSYSFSGELRFRSPFPNKPIFFAPPHPPT